MSLWIVATMMVFALAFLERDRFSYAAEGFANLLQNASWPDERFSNLVFFGGGSTPADYANKVQFIHAAFLDGTYPTESLTEEEFESRYGDFPTLTDFVVTALSAGSPFEGEDPYDPSDDMDELQARIEDLLGSVAPLDPSTSDILNDAVDWASTKLPDLLADAVDADVASAIAANQALSLTEHAGAVSRFEAGMYDQRAVMNTQYGVGLSIMEGTRGAALQRESAALRISTFRERSSLAATLVNVYLSQYSRAMDARRLLVATQFDAAKIRNAAFTDQINQRIEFASRDQVHPMEIMQYVPNYIAGLGGAVMTPRAATKGEKFVSTVTNAIATAFNVGAQAGSPEMGIATGIGAGALSLGASLISDYVR